MEIKGKTIITVLLIVAVLVIGFVVAAFMTDLSPDITPDYGRSFSAGAAPLSLDVGINLANINITQYNISLSKSQYVIEANWTYDASAGTIVITPMINATGGDITVVAEHAVDVSSLWVKVAGVVGFVIIIALLFLIFKALPRKD